MVCTWLARWTARRTARTQAPSTVSASSSYDSQTANSTLESKELRKAQTVPDTQDLLQTQAPSLGLLPTELILLVSELLPDADAVCLALTCKRICLVSNIPYLARRLNAYSTETLLCRLERDNTGVSYCVVDQRLARFPGRWSIPPNFHFHTVMKSRGPHDVFFGYSSFSLSWCSAHLVTNHQIIGPQHGLPLSSLACKYEHPYPELGVCWKEVWSAKLIHGELFISCTHTIFNKNADPSTLNTYFNANIIAVCDHKAVGIGKHYRTVTALPTNITENTEYYDMGWCWKCATDWETSIQWADTARGCTVTVRTYHGLGTCRLPYDPKWQAMNSINKPFRGVPGKAVKAAWEENERHSYILNNEYMSGNVEKGRG